MTNVEIVEETGVQRCNDEFYWDVSNRKLESVQVIFDNLMFIGPCIVLIVE